LPDFLRQLRTAVDTANGDARVELAFLFPDRVAPVAEASYALRWRVEPVAFQQLRGHAAVAGVQVEARAPELKEQRRWNRR
jgi:DNA polymerase-3 subunit alpha